MKIDRNDSSMIYNDVAREVSRSKEIHQERFNSLPELMGVLHEEVDEVFDRIKETKINNPDPAALTELHKELIQVAAVAIKGIESFCIIGRPTCFKRYPFANRHDNAARLCTLCTYERECIYETHKSEEKG